MWIGSDAGERIARGGRIGERAAAKRPRQNETGRFPFPHGRVRSVAFAGRKGDRKERRPTPPHTPQLPQAHVCAVCSATAPSSAM